MYFYLSLSTAAYARATADGQPSICLCYGGSGDSRGRGGAAARPGGGNDLTSFSKLRKCNVFFLGIFLYLLYVCALLVSWSVVVCILLVEENVLKILKGLNVFMRC